MYTPVNGAAVSYLTVFKLMFCYYYCIIVTEWGLINEDGGHTVDFMEAFDQLFSALLVEEFYENEECLHCHIRAHRISDGQVGMAATTKESRQVSVMKVI